MLNNKRFQEFYDVYIKESKVLCIGITGGMGSGKTLIAKELERNGFTVFYSDIVAKEIMASDRRLQQELIKATGINDLFSPEGELHKDLLRRYIQSSPERAKIVNDLVHPRVAQAYCDLVRVKNESLSPITNSAIRYMAFHLPEVLLASKQTINMETLFARFKRLARERVIFVESAILYESGFNELVHSSIFVDAPVETRARRVMRRDKITKQEVQAWFAMQTAKAEAKYYSDIIVLNHHELVDKHPMNSPLKPKY